MSVYLFVVFSLFIVLACFKIAEDAVVGKIHGKSFHESLADLGGGTWTGILCLTLLLFIVLIPFFGYTEPSCGGSSVRNGWWGSFFDRGVC